MKYLFFLGHPAHFHLFKNIIKNLEAEKHTVFILIKKKDILEELLDNANFKYFNILLDGRKDGALGILWGLLKKDIRMFFFCLKYKPDLLLGYSAEISHVGKLLNIPSININEDDADAIKIFSKIAYPWATYLLSPSSCDNSQWNNKTIKYNGYHELAYLHPNHFAPDKQVVSKYFSPNEKYFILRFAKLSAHHDKGIRGINSEIALKLIEIIEPKGKIYITSERELEPEFEKYRIEINPLDIHHVLYFAKLYIGDSQTMAAEAGVLGTPFIRFNDFVGKIGYLNELEQKYKLGFGFKTNELYTMLDKLKELINMTDLDKVWESRRSKMLSENIDTAKFMTWLLSNFPESVTVMKRDPDYTKRFK